MNGHPVSNPQSALPIQGLSKRAQELLKPVKNQVNLPARNAAERFRELSKRRI